MRFYPIIVLILISTAIFAQPAESVEIIETEQEAVAGDKIAAFRADADQRAREIVGRMTLWEKCMLISGKKGGFHTFEIPRLGVPSIRMADGPQGVRNNTRSTFYPCGISLSATWNPSVVQEIGRGLGLDCKARGVDILLGPGVNIYRSAYCGRNFEYYGEDPFLASEIACSYITGLQNEGVMATIKHFAANNQEEWRHRTNSVVDERTLNEIYFPVFRNAVRNVGVGAVMTSYNPLNGVHAAENKELIEGILRDKWGFDGIVMSDWRSTYTTVGCVESGLDLEMPSGFMLNYEAVSELVDRGIVSVDDIDKKCVNILRTFIRFGFLDRQKEETVLPLDNQECCDIAYHAALEGPVMMKNTGVLPLGRKDRNIVLLGPNADFVPFGGGSGAVTAIEGRTTTIYSAMKSLGCNRTITLLHPDGDGRYDSEAISKADAVIVCVGFHKDTEKEGADRTYNLPEGQDSLVEMAAALCDKVIVCVNSGGEIATPWIEDVEGLIMDWYPGQEGGRALASILYGKVSPSGRLPFTFWGNEEKNPSYSYYGTKYNPVPPAWRDTLAHTLYHEGIFLGYRGMKKFDRTPMYPFGFGLTYSDFEYSDFKVVPCSEGFNVTFTLKNIGKTTAAEVAQIYVSAVSPTVPKPGKELKGFRKISLEPGESQHVSIFLGRDAFAHYDVQKHDFIVDSGEYRVSVASDALTDLGECIVTLR